MPAVASTASTATAIALDPGFGGSISGMMFSGGFFGGAPPTRNKPPPPVPYRRSSGGAPLAGPGMPGSTLASLPEDGAPLSATPQQPPASGPYRESTAARSARSLSRSLSRLSTASSLSSWQPVPLRRPPSRASSHSHSPGGDSSLPLTLAPLLLDEPEQKRPLTAGSTYSAPNDRFPPVPSPLSASYGPSAPFIASSTSLPTAASSASLSLPDLASRRLPELSPALPGPISRLGLPPPFTLEPAPRWNRESHDPFAPAPRKMQTVDDRASEASYSPPGVNEPGASAHPHPPPGLHYPARLRSASPPDSPESPMDEDMEFGRYRNNGNSSGGQRPC